MQEKHEDISSDGAPKSAPILDIESLRHDAAKLIPEDIPEAKKFKVTYSYAELRKMSKHEQKFVVPQLLPRASVSLLLGEDGVGKSQLMGQLCLHICFGHEHFCGIRMETQSKKCLFVGTEDAKVKFAKAITTQADILEPKHNPEDVQIFFTEASLFDDWTELKEEVENMMAEHDFDLIVIDTMGDMFGLMDGDINSTKDARKILGYFSNLAESTQDNAETAIVVIHHVAKSHMNAKRQLGQLFIKKDDALGASGITQRARTVLALTNDPSSSSPDGSYYTNYLHVVKANLMGRTYAVNALKLSFTTETLLHKFEEYTDIFAFEQERKKQQGKSVQREESDSKSVGGQVRKLTPKEIPDKDHWKYLKEVFREREPLKRDELIKRMAVMYNCGNSKIEASGGFLPYLRNEKKWIELRGSDYIFIDTAYNDIGDDPNEKLF